MLRLTTLLLFLCFTVTSNAQRVRGDINVTAFIGISNSVFASSDDIDFKSNQGLSAGISANYYLSERTSIRTGIMSTSMGGENKTTGREDRLRYLAVPLNISVHFLKYKQLAVNLGPMFMFNTKAERANSDGTPIDQDVLTNDYEFGVNLGIGYRIPLDDTFDLYFDAQGYGGFIDVYDNANELYEVRNFAVAVHVGTTIKLQGGLFK